MWRDDLDLGVLMRSMSHRCLATQLLHALIGRDVPEIATMAGVFAGSWNVGATEVWEEFLRACNELTDDNRLGRELATLGLVDVDTYLGAVAQAAALSELASEPSELEAVCLPIVERFDVEADWESQLTLACGQAGGRQPSHDEMELISDALTIVATSRAMAALSSRLTPAGARLAMERAADVLAGTGFDLPLLTKSLPVFDPT